MKHIVEGQSMLPFLGDLDECLSEKVPFEEILPGDLVIYDDKELKELVAHRVISIPKDEPFMFLKGDNEPRAFTARIPHEDILGKVLSVKKTSGKTRNMKVLPWRFFNRILGFLSRHDLTPFLFRRRFIDPVLLFISRSSLYISLRKRFYSGLMFIDVGGEGQNKVYALVGGTRSGEAFLEPLDDGKVLVSSFLRHRDRNPVFAEKFLQKISDTIDDKYGPDRHIFITGEIFCTLLKSGIGNYDAGRIHLTQ